MAATQGSKISFVYVNGSTLPANPSADTVYFVPGTGLYVGSVLIANNDTGFDPSAIEARLDALEDGQITVTITGDGPDVTGVTFANNVLTITKGDAGYLTSADLDSYPTTTEMNRAIADAVDAIDIPEYTVSKLATPTAGSSATYRLTKDGTAVGDAIEIPEETTQVVYSIAESTTTTGYAKTYSLTADGVETGVKINIPKDLVVQSGQIQTVTTADTPYQGAAVGDKYIDLTLNDATEDHIYIPVEDLVDVYTAGTGINISASNEISVDTTVIATTTYVDDAIEAAALTWTVV